MKTGSLLTPERCHRPPAMWKETGVVRASHPKVSQNRQNLRNRIGHQIRLAAVSAALSRRGCRQDRARPAVATTAVLDHSNHVSNEESRLQIDGQRYGNLSGQDGQPPATWGRWRAARPSPSSSTARSTPPGNAG